MLSSPHPSVMSGVACARPFHIASGCDRVPAARCRSFAGTGAGLLQRQDHHALCRNAAGRRNRQRDADGGALFWPFHSGRAGHYPAEHAGCRRHDPRQLSLQRGEAGRPYTRHARPIGICARAHRRRRRRQIRSAQVQLDRQLREQQLHPVDGQAEQHPHGRGTQGRQSADHYRRQRQYHREFDHSGSARPLRRISDQGRTRLSGHE